MNPNPVLPAPQASPDYLEDIEPRRDPLADDWGNPDITAEELLVKYGPQKIEEVLDE